MFITLSFSLCLYFSLLNLINIVSSSPPLTLAESINIAKIQLVLPSIANSNLPKSLSTPIPYDGTVPPQGALIVRKNAGPNEYSTIGAAVQALWNSSQPPNPDQIKTIFIHPGEYEEHVVITYPGPLRVMGYTTSRKSYRHNMVNITGSLVASVAGGDELSATVTITKDDFAMYNVNVFNRYVKRGKFNQAVALSGKGSKQAYYSCRFVGYQDTLLTLGGYHYYSHCYIEGAIDYVFTQQAVAWFEKTTLASVGKGSISANGRKDPSSISEYIFNNATVISAGAPVGSVCLGRPWGNYSRVAFQNSHLSDVVASSGWCPWGKSDERTNHALYEEYGNWGAGAVQGPMNVFPQNLTNTKMGVPLSARAPFSRQRLRPYKIQDHLGRDYVLWVDAHFRASTT